MIRRRSRHGHIVPTPIEPGSSLPAFRVATATRKSTMSPIPVAPRRIWDMPVRAHRQAGPDQIVWPTQMAGNVNAWFNVSATFPAGTTKEQMQLLLHGILVAHSESTP
jgi:hypothetical protein